MIDLQIEASRTTRQFWSGHVRQLIQILDLDDRIAAPEISESLATFCEQHSHMPNHALFLLMARSFCAIGDAEAAIQILQHDHLYRAHAQEWVGVLSAKYPFPELYPLFSSRVLYPLHLHTVGESCTWELDLEKIHLSAADRHELILMQTLRILVEKVSNVWKKTDGEGTLAVKGLPRLDAFLYSHSEQNLLDYLRDVLCCCARKNGWASTPAVLLLDL
ncbi:MAG: hypothetical protein OEL75_00015 [Kiritimatiellaceae bacterium]|nr:hypothetical protein [Kiritimatiellaceae bacterium]